MDLQSILREEKFQDIRINIGKEIKFSYLLKYFFFICILKT